LFLISSFSKTKRWWTVPLGSGMLRVRSMDCLTWQCKGTLVGEVEMSLYSSMTLSIYCCCVEEPCLESVVTTFFLPWERIIRKAKFLVWEMILVHCFAVIKEMVVGEATLGILYNLLAKVIIIDQGLDSYTSCHIHKYDFPNNTLETSRGETSHSTSSVKGLML